MNRESTDRPDDRRRPPRRCEPPTPRRPLPPPATPHQIRPEWADWAPARGGIDVCDRCRAFDWACFCEVAPAQLALFARRIAELHPPVYPGGCGCGTRQCVYRQRLDDIRPPTGG